jgi:hypothetical protein
MIMIMIMILNCFFLLDSRRNRYVTGIKPLRWFQGTDLSAVEEFIRGGKRVSLKITTEIELEIIVVTETVIVAVIMVGFRVRGLRWEKRRNTRWASGSTEEEVVCKTLRGRRSSDVWRRTVTVKVKICRKWCCNCSCNWWHHYLYLHDGGVCV